MLFGLFWFFWTANFIEAIFAGFNYTNFSAVYLLISPAYRFLYISMIISVYYLAFFKALSYFNVSESTLESAVSFILLKLINHRSIECYALERTLKII